MSIQQAPYYWLTCDGPTTDGGVCGAKSTENDEYSAYEDPDSAWANAEGSDWLERGGKHYCEGCAEMFVCSECGFDTNTCAGHNTPLDVTL